MIANLQDLQRAFNAVEITYTRKDPTTNEETQLTTLQTTSKISMSDEALASISEKVASIRNNIVMPTGN